MADTISKERRSALMSRIRSTDTRPELTVRRLLHGLGYRYVLHDKRLPGKPDVVLPRHRKIVLVHGCFWHGHACKIARNPKSNTAYWNPKIARNKQRDNDNRLALEAQGWRVLEVWECESRDAPALIDKLIQFMDDQFSWCDCKSVPQAKLKPRGPT